MTERTGLVTTNADSYGAVRKAFHDRDAEASRLAHEEKRHVRATIAHMENHGGAGSDFIKSIVFGGLDGIMTTFAIITAAAGVGADYKTILILGLSNKIADAFSMGFGEFVGGMAEIDYALSERRREEWEVENCPDSEMEEMVGIYMKRGIEEEDARRIVSIISKDPKIFVDFMMVDELKLIVDTDDTWAPVKQGCVMFLSFAGFGIIPLSAYFSGQGKGTDKIFFIAIGLTALALIILGALKGYLAEINMVKSALLMIANGIVAGMVSYTVGLAVHDFLGGGEITMMG